MKTYTSDWYRMFAWLPIGPYWFKYVWVRTYDVTWWDGVELHIERDFEVQLEQPEEV